MYASSFHMLRTIKIVSVPGCVHLSLLLVGYAFVKAAAVANLVTAA